MALGYAQDLKFFGFEAVAERLVHDMAKLLNPGLSLYWFQSKSQLTMPVVILNIMGDNLGLNELFGFKKSFSSGSFCRICHCSYNDIQAYFHENSRSLRNPVDYDQAIAQLDETSSKATGINHQSAFNAIPHFHVTQNCGADLMHDILEGVAQIESALILRELVREKVVTVDFINSKIASFPYGRTDSRNKPSEILAEKIKGGRNLKQKASQMWCLLRLLPLMIGSSIPKGNVFWNFFLDLCDIVDILFSPVQRATFFSIFHLHKNYFGVVKNLKGFL